MLASDTKMMFYVVNDNMNDCNEKLNRKQC